MNQKKLIRRIAYLGVALFLINLITLRLHWYSSIWYFDMLMHLAGGFFVGLLLFHIFYFFNFFKDKKVFRILWGVLIIGIFWEIFEIIFFNYLAGHSFIILDTISDLFFDLMGGALAIIYFLKRIMIQEENTV